MTERLKKKFISALDATNGSASQDLSKWKKTESTYGNGRNKRYIFPPFSVLGESMTGPEFFQTAMGRQFYDGTMPEIAKALRRIATAMEAQISHKEKEIYKKENILKYAREDELFALFHTFKEYYNQAVHDVEAFTPLDHEIGEVVKKLKENYK